MSDDYDELRRTLHDPIVEVANVMHDLRSGVAHWLPGGKRACELAERLSDFVDELKEANAAVEAAVQFDTAAMWSTEQLDTEEAAFRSRQ